MPTVKAKGSFASPRYRPASEYDDAKLALKREYWRNKKREQRARLSEKRGKPKQDTLARQLPTPEAESPLSSGSCALAFPLQSNDRLIGATDISPPSYDESAADGGGGQLKHNKIYPRLQSPCSAVETVKWPVVGDAVSRATTSCVPNGIKLNTSSSVPPVPANRLTNGRSAKAGPQLCMSLQNVSVPTSQNKGQVTFHIQPKLLPITVNTGESSSSCSMPTRRESNIANIALKTGGKSALVNTLRAKGGAHSQPSPETEEEKAARRREHWRIKKREQRARLAARLAKARGRKQGADQTVDEKATENTELPDGAVLPHRSLQSFQRGSRLKLLPTRCKTSLRSAKNENNKLPAGVANLLPGNPRADQMIIQNLCGPKHSQTVDLSGDDAGKKMREPLRKFTSYTHLSTVTRAIARCKSPRQRFLEVQKNYTAQRNTRAKSLSLASVYSSRNIPHVDPSDTPEQAVAKRREYWRIKKREQRAKLSMETKAWLKEKDSLMRRVKRYRKVIEEMRGTGASSQSTESVLTHAAETIGGFIKEDGTVTVNIHQAATGHVVAAHKSKGDGTPAARPEHQSKPEWTALQNSQVKVTLPLARQSVRLRPVRLVTQQKSTASTEATLNPKKLTVGQLTLTHTSNIAESRGMEADSRPFGCVMKMAVLSSTPSLSTVALDPELTDEERMAKKREYWRVKKREQRAARAACLKQGNSQVRIGSTFHRRRAHRQGAVVAPPSRSLLKQTGNQQHLSVVPHVNEVKQERESVPEVDLFSEPEQAICPEIKPPTSPSVSPPVAQLEPDPALSADNQATTLLAVASMKKLLEESLSTVTDFKSVQTDIKMEINDEPTNPVTKPNLSQLFFGNDEATPLTADLTLQIKSWKAGTKALDPESPPLKAQAAESTLPLSTTDKVVLNRTCDHSSQTPSNFIVSPSMEVPEVPSAPCRSQRLRTRKTGYHSCCSPEPPKLHHLPLSSKDPQQHSEQQFQAQDKGRNATAAQRCPSVAMETSGTNSTSSLQRKREYWKLMKRQQRARLKARQNDRSKEYSRPSLRDIQMNVVKDVNSPGRSAIQTKPTIVASIPSMLIISPANNSGQSCGIVQVKPPVTSERVDRGGGVSAATGPWVDLVNPLPPLTPPDNPLSSMNLQPIELPPHAPQPTISLVDSPHSSRSVGSHLIKTSPLNNLVPPKLAAGESEADFLRRKREYWRIKKKEQRARKAIQERGGPSRRAPTSWSPVLPPQESEIPQDQWPNSDPTDRDTEHLTSDGGSYPLNSYTAPLQDESELLLSDYEFPPGEEGLVSETTWRRCYLMDYDPLHQLLVCMVCGELQYSVSLEGAQAHISEAHPNTLTLEPPEQQRILEAWDEQVSQRERFFTSQMQQHGGTMSEAEQ